MLPSYIPQEQRHLVFRPKYKRKLEIDPVVVHVDGDVHSFGYMNKLTDFPNTNKAVGAAIRAMRKPGDFEQLPRLLAGVCVQAGRKIKPDYFPRMVRRAADAGRLDVIMRCVESVDRTGFKLNTPETVNELLVSIQKAAADRNWDKGETEKALKRTQQVLDVMEEEPAHHRDLKGKHERLQRYPLYRDPQFLAARLHMEAALALKHHDGKDVDGLVARHANQIVQLWPAKAGLLDLHPDEAYNHAEGVKYMLHRRTFVWAAAPVLSALRKAAQVVDSALATELKSRADKVEEELEIALRAAGGEGRGVDFYRKLFGKHGR